MGNKRLTDDSDGFPGSDRKSATRLISLAPVSGRRKAPSSKLSLPCASPTIPEITERQTMAAYYLLTGRRGLPPRIIRGSGSGRFFRNSQADDVTETRSRGRLRAPVNKHAARSVLVSLHQPARQKVHKIRQKIIL